MGGKLRFSAEDVEFYIASQSNTTPPGNAVSATKQRRDAKAFKQRQEAAEAALDRHRTVKGGKSK